MAKQIQMTDMKKKKFNLNNIYFENNQTIHQNIVITYMIQKQAIMLL